MTEQYKAIASPAVRKFAIQNNVDLKQLANELGQDMVSMNDVKNKLEPKTQTSHNNYWNVDHADYGEIETVPLSRFQQLSAQNLAAAQQCIPAVTHHDTGDLTLIEAFRKSLKEEAASKNCKLTTLAFHVKILAKALQKFPKFNASLNSDATQLILKKYVHIAIAVDTPYGLIVPVIRDADKKTVWDIAHDLMRLSEKAGLRKIAPHELGGASATISNLGSIGGQAFTPIINPPEVAILGISRAKIEAVWDGKAFKPLLMCPLDLTYDHRVVNGAEAALFMAYYSQVLSNPLKLSL